MSTDEELGPWLRQYRMAADGVPTPGLDRTILAAMQRELVRRRRTRHATRVLLAGAVIVGAGMWASRDMRPRAFAVTNYGRLEGMTLSYLLEPAQQSDEPGLPEAQP